MKKFGPAAFEKCLNGSAGQNDYRLETLQQKHSLADEEGRMAFLREAVETVAALQSPIEREIYGNKAAAAAGISSSAFAQGGGAVPQEPGMAGPQEAGPPGS